MAEPQAVDAIESGCRYFAALLTVGVSCHKAGTVANCHECHICPKCGCITTYTEHCIADVNATGQTIIEVRVCPICGNRTRGVEIKIVEHVEAEPPSPDRFMCEVVGCNRGAHEMFTHRGRFICLFHRGQMQTHKYYRMEQARFPLLLKEGKLVENVKFNLYKARRKS